MADGAVEIKRLGKLARTGFSEDEVQRLARQVEAIVGYFNRLKTLDLKSVEPSSHVVPIICPLRPDEPVRAHEIAARLTYFKLSYFVVPRAIE